MLCDIVVIFGVRQKGTRMQICKNVNLGNLKRLIRNTVEPLEVSINKIKEIDIGEINK